MQSFNRYSLFHVLHSGIEPKCNKSLKKSQIKMFQLSSDIFYLTWGISGEYLISVFT